jgi:hypothetical protein
MTRWIASLEAALTPGLARRAGLALATSFAVALAIWCATAPGGVRADGAPLGADFVTFHAAGRLALEGRLTEAYDAAAITAAEQVSVPGQRLTYLWRHPPPFALVAAALGALPYFVAYALWVLAGIAALGSGLQRLLPGRDGWLLALAAPASFVCVLHGQTGLYTAAAFAWGFALLPRRPWLAGAVLGLLVCKPHFAVLVPLALLAGGRWRALAGFAASAAALCLLALAAFGIEPWRAFLHTAPDMLRILTEGGLSWVKIPSAFALALSLGAGPMLAGAAQTVSALLAAGVTVWAWRSGGPVALKAATTCAAALLISPYLFDYDLTLVSVALALAVSAGAMTRDGSGLKPAFALALATPAAAPALAQLTGVQLGGLPLAALLAALAAAQRTYGREAMPAGSAAGCVGTVKLTERVVG